jgi:hypothetical protein
MYFSGENSFLLLRKDSDNRQSVAVIPDGSEAFSLWNSSARLSPIFGVVKTDGVKSPTSFSFDNEWHLVFVGPIHPEEVPGEITASATAWLTIGLYNVILATTDICVSDALTEWATRNGLPFEYWNLIDGSVNASRAWSQPEIQNGWRANLISLWKSGFDDELKEAVQEYCPMMASAISRSAGIPYGFSSDLITFSNTVTALLRVFKDKANADSPYWALGQFLVINAALSRFSSQTFAGTSPILTTECHFWLHSLLGIGLPTIVLRNIRVFLEKTLGKSRLHDRFAELKKQINNVDLTKDSPPARDYLGEIDLEQGQPIVPLLTYFSARDGYRSTEMTVSAPLAAVSSCNSLRWSLLTLTHEFSHVVIRRIQADLYPSFDNVSDLDACLKLIKDRRPGETTFDEIRRLLLFSIIKIDDIAMGRKTGDSVELNHESLKKLLQRWRSEIDELFVHVFDFMYFYGQHVERYVTGIWASWGTIPNIRTRVLDYVVRTICAVLTKHLRRDAEGEVLARDQVKKVLHALQSRGGGGPYIQIAIDLMTADWDRIVQPRVRARRQLVKIVNAYLFSEKIATQVRGELAITSSVEGKRDGYAFRQRDLSVSRLTNPLHFIEIYTNSIDPDATESAWMLYILAFGFKTDE